MLQAKGIAKSFGANAALKDLSFSVDRGCVFGLLGANGAGKTTTLRILTGCLAPDRGTVEVGGFDVYEQKIPAKRQIGYLPEVPPLYPDMTPLEYLCFVAQAKGIAKEMRDPAIKASIERTSLKKVLHRLIAHLSKGYRQRVGLAAALLGDPAVLILDEPTVGLDPVQIVETRQLIRDYGREHTVILSSHILSEVESVCQKVLILSQGQKVALDTPENLIRSQGKQAVLELSVKAERKPLEDCLASLKVPGLRWEILAYREGVHKLEITCPQGRDLREEVFFAFSNARLPVLQMNQRTLSLEGVFMELNRAKKGGGESDSHL